MFEATSAPEQFTEMAPQDGTRYLAEVAAPLYAKHAKDTFDAMLRNVMRRHVGGGAAADAAVASGSFTYQGDTAVIRLNPLTDCVEIFVDMGLPGDSVDHVDIYGRLLEMNLNCAHYGVLFGRNERSRRLVASHTMHIALADEEGELCDGCLQMVAQAVRSVRTW